MYVNYGLKLKNIIILNIIFSVLFFITFVIIIYGNVFSYYYKIIESLKLYETLGSGHTLDSVWAKFINNFNELITNGLYLYSLCHNKYNLCYFGIIIFISLVFILNKFKRLHFIMFIVFYVYFLLLIKNNYFDRFQNSNLLWSIYFEIILLGLIIFIILALIKKDINISKILFIILYMNLGSFAYAFGTNNNIIYFMSGSIIFPVSSLLIINNFFYYKIYYEKNIIIFSTILLIFVAIIAYTTINRAYNNPYRLETSISEQNKYVNVLGGLRVDDVQYDYITKLVKIKNYYKSNDKNKIYLLDLTGGSPIANLILDAKFFGLSWLLGGYKGSDDFVFNILRRYGDENKLSNAWVLYAPKGTRKIDLKILKRLNLQFPFDYEKVIELKTKHRNEIQQLWIPKRYLDVNKK